MLDGRLFASGLRAQPRAGDIGPHNFSTDDMTPRDVVADSPTLRTTHFSLAVPGALHFLAVDADRTLLAWGSPRPPFNVALSDSV